MQKNVSLSRVTVDTKNLLILPSFFLYLFATEQIFSPILLSNKNLFKFVTYISSNFILPLYFYFLHYFHLKKRFKEKLCAYYMIL